MKSRRSEACGTPSLGAPFSRISSRSLVALSMISGIIVKWPDDCRPPSGPFVDGERGSEALLGAALGRAAPGRGAGLRGPRVREAALRDAAGRPLLRGRAGRTDLFRRGRQ